MIDMILDIGSSKHPFKIAYYEYLDQASKQEILMEGTLTAI